MSYSVRVRNVCGGRVEGGGNRTWPAAGASHGHSWCRAYGVLPLQCNRSSLVYVHNGFIQNCWKVCSPQWREPFCLCVWYLWHCWVELKPVLWMRRCRCKKSHCVNHWSTNRSLYAVNEMVVSHTFWIFLAGLTGLGYWLIRVRCPVPLSDSDH